MRRNALFILKKAFLYLKNMPTCRDRRPRLETPPSLPQGEECLTVTYLNGSFYPKGCHKVGTDALVCPPEYSQRKPPQAPQKEKMLPDGMTHRGKWADRRGRLSLLCSTLFHRPNSSFTCQPAHPSTHTNHTLEVKQNLWGGHPLLRRGLGRL